MIVAHRSARRPAHRSRRRALADRVSGLTILSVSMFMLTHDQRQHHLRRPAGAVHADGRWDRAGDVADVDRRDERGQSGQGRRRLGDPDSWPGWSAAPWVSRPPARSSQAQTGPASRPRPPSPARSLGDAARADFANALGSAMDALGSRRPASGRGRRPGDDRGRGSRDGASSGGSPSTRLALEHASRPKRPARARARRPGSARSSRGSISTSTSPCAAIVSRFERLHRVRVLRPRGHHHGPDLQARRPAPPRSSAACG